MPRIFEIQNTPTVAEYVRALIALSTRITEEHRSLFRVHYQAPACTATAKQLAIWAGIAGRCHRDVGAGSCPRGGR